MKTSKNIYWIQFFLGMAFVLFGLATALSFASTGCISISSECMNENEQEQTAERARVFSTKFEELSAENQKLAQHYYGYKAGDMVQMLKDSAGTLYILPPLTGSNTPEQMRMTLYNLICEKIAREITSDIEVIATLALDYTGYFTIRLKFETLSDELQAQAKKLGFSKGETVEVKLDAGTWAYQILPKEKKPPFKISFQCNVLYVLPPKEAGGPSVYHLIASYSDIPKELQKRAQKMKYGKKDQVYLLYQEDTQEFEILPPPLLFALGKSFKNLESKNQQTARSLGYDENDNVWITFGRTIADQTIVPKATAGSGPLYRIQQVKMDADKQTGQLKIKFECTARFEVLNPITQQAARAKGHNEGDWVRLDYDVKEEKFEVKSSGVSKKPAIARAAPKEPTVGMSAEEYLNRGLANRKKRRVDQEIAEYSQAIEVNPLYFEAYLYRGMAYYSKGLYDKAISDYTQAIEIDPTFAQVYLYRGLAFGHNDLRPKAISDYTKVIELDPKYTNAEIMERAYRERGDAYYDDGQYDKAISDYTKVIEIEPKSTDMSLYWAAFNNRGSAYFKKGLYNEAVDDYNKAIDIDPKNDIAFRNRGAVFYRQGLYEQAIADYTKALQLNPKHSLTFKDKALALEKAGLTDEAIETYKTFLQKVHWKDVSHIAEAKKKIQDLELRSPETVKLFPITQNGQAGYIDETGAMIIQPQYDEAFHFSDGLAKVKVGDMYSFIDQQGEQIKVTDIDKNGIVKTEITLYGTCGSFWNDLAVVNIDGKWGFIDPTGRIVIAPKYDAVIDFYEGLAAVKIKGKWGYIDKSGEMVIKPKFMGAGSFHEGLAWVNTEYQVGFIDRTGKLVIQPSTRLPLLGFHNGLAAVESNGKWGYIDKTGKWVIKIQYDDAREFYTDLAAVELDGKWGYIDKTGKLVIEAKYGYAGYFYDGLAAVKLDRKWGYIDATGQIVIPPQFDEADRFHKGLAAVEVDNKRGYIDKTGKYIWAPTK